MATNASQRDDDDVERQLQIQYDVSAALAGSDGITEAAPRVLAAIARHLDWPVGIFWLVDEHAGVLRAEAVLGGNSAHGEFLRGLATATFERGSGLPGRVWDSGAPSWVSDVTDLQSYPRQQSARRSGLRAAIAFPLAVGGRMLGVLEFYATTITHADDALFRSLTGVCNQVAQFVERKLAARSANDAQARAAAMISTALDAVVMMDARGRVIEWNAAAERTFGWTASEAIGQPLRSLIIPPSMRDAHDLGLSRYLETGAGPLLDRRVETRAVRRDGTEIPVELSITRIPFGGPPTFAGHLRDLTERHRFADEQRLLLEAGTLLASSLDYETTLRNLNSVVVPAFADWYAVDVLDAQQRLVRLVVEHRDRAKVAAARELAEHYPDGPGRTYGAEVVVRTGQPQLVPAISEDVLTGVARDAEHLRLVRALGLQSFIIVPMRTSERVVGAITFVSAESGRRYDERDLRLAEELARRAGQAIENARLFRELRETRQALEEQATELETQSDELQHATTELEATIEDLQDANEELVKRTHEAERARSEAEAARRDADLANRAKAEFLATMSHELRTPLNAIVGYAQLLEVGVHGAMSHDQAADVARILRSSHHLLGLINDLLNFAKVEAGQLQLKIREIEVADVIGEVEDLVRPQSRQKQLEYAFDNRCPGARVRADRDKLAQVFANLLTNAIQFTPAGGKISVVCTDDERWVTTEVRDTGIGIAADKLETIFEPFVQLAMQYSGERQGTGLGLSITRELVRAMGGEVSVRSQPGAGSTFTVRLPRA